MKNLLRKFKLKDMIDKSPKELLFYHSCKYWDSWSKGHGESHPVNGVWAWNRARRIIENNIGKSFSLAFSYYCKISPKYQQKDFLEEFNRTRWRGGDYYIDSEGLIQKTKEDKPIKPAIFYSDDYETELVHKVWGVSRKWYKDKISKERYLYGNKQVFYFKYDDWNRLVKREGYKKEWKRVPYHEAKYSDFIEIVVSGWKQEFSSKNDYKYKRLRAEQIKRKNKADELKWLEKENKFEEALAKTLRERKEQEKKEKELNHWKIIKHGFDPLTSFRK